MMQWILTFALIAAPVSAAILGQKLGSRKALPPRVTMALTLSGAMFLVLSFVLWSNTMIAALLLSASGFLSSFGAFAEFQNPFWRELRARWRHRRASRKADS